jgi:hypothetical protein
MDRAGPPTYGKPKQQNKSAIPWRIKNLGFGLPKKRFGCQYIASKLHSFCPFSVIANHEPAIAPIG